MLLPLFNIGNILITFIIILILVVITSSINVIGVDLKLLAWKVSD